MQCKNRWERDFLIKATLKSFVNGEYHTHRANLLLEQEKSRLPETMPLVENYLKVADEKKKKETIRKKINALRTELNGLRNAEFICSRIISGDIQTEKLVVRKRPSLNVLVLSTVASVSFPLLGNAASAIFGSVPTCMEIKGVQQGRSTRM